MYNQSPFASWVPKPLMLLLIILTMFPMMSINGVYTSNATDLSGSLASYSEFVSMANNAGSIGMGLSLLIVFRIKMRFRSKEIITTSTIILALLSLMNGTTENPYLLVVGSFLIGFIKMFPMIEIILPLMFILSPKGDRGRFYSIFYPISIGFGQFSSYFFANLSFHQSYQSPYFLMSILMLVITCVSLIFQHDQRFSFKKPLYQIDWLSMILLGSSAMSFNVFFTFMRQQGWFTSPYIRTASFLSFLFLGLTIWRQKFLKRPLIDFKVFIRENTLHSLVLLLFLGIFLASSSIYVQYSIGVLGYNNLINAKINLWMIPGVILAGVLAFYCFKYSWKMKLYIAGGFVCFFLHTLCLYLLIQPQINVEYLQYTMVLKGLGMGMLFISIWFYAADGIPMDGLFGAMGVLIMIRGFLGTALGGAIISWALYQGQWQSLNDISMFLDNGNFPNGMSIYQSTSLNAMMASSKIVLGSLCWLTIPILIFVLTHHYGQFNYRRVVFFRKLIKGDSVKGYRIAS